MHVLQKIVAFVETLAVELQMDPANALTRIVQPEVYALRYMQGMLNNISLRRAGMDTRPAEWEKLTIRATACFLGPVSTSTAHHI